MNKKQILIILIPTFIFVVLWICFNIYHGIVSSTISQTENMQIAPISPNFDTNVINKLKQREVITPIYQVNGSSQNTQTPSISQIPTPSVSSQSGSQASSGGNLNP